MTIHSLRIGTKETHDILHGCRLYWSSTVKSHFFKTHFLFYTNLRVWVFKCKLQIRVGWWRPDSYSETSQVISSCLGASFVACSCMPRACSTQSAKRILPPISFFSRREATSHNDLNVNRGIVDETLKSIRCARGFRNNDSPC